MPDEFQKVPPPQNLRLFQAEVAAFVLDCAKRHEIPDIFRVAVLAHLVGKAVILRSDSIGVPVEQALRMVRANMQQGIDEAIEYLRSKLPR